MFRSLAYKDFDRAFRRAFWRKIGAWLTGKSNELIPYKEVREHLPLANQRNLGLQTIEVDKIIGSVGRYRDFDRAFLPIQRVTTDRWVNIKTAVYQEKELPPIDVYKLGEVYFVRDGNHRVSVARERNAIYIDAYVTEIELPVKVTPESNIDDIVRQKEYAIFMQQTGLANQRPDADLRLSEPRQYGRLRDHINTHRYYLGLEQKRDISPVEAAVSWYDNVYQPLTQAIIERGLHKAFPHQTPTDLYWWVSEYQWLLKETEDKESVVQEAASRLAHIYKEKDVQQVLHKLQHARWIDDMILAQERQHFLEYTHIQDIRPNANIALSLPGKYRKMLHHISAHRYYMGEKAGHDVPYEEAVASWYDNAYLPLVSMLREQHTLDDFPGRTEADLYLWVVDHRQDLAASFLAQDGE